MVRAFSPVVQHALCELGALQSQAGIGHRVTCAGDPRRRERVFLPLQVRWAQHHFLDRDPAPYIAPAKPARLRLVADRRRA